MTLFFDHESLARSFRNIQTIRGAIGGQEDVIRTCVDNGRKITGQLNLRFTFYEFGFAEILEPAFGTFHTIQPPM
jgi:hypothetical protein